MDEGGGRNGGRVAGEGSKDLEVGQGAEGIGNFPTRKQFIDFQSQ